MLTSIRIQGFKGFRDTEIKPIRNVNLILGGQNVGKTSLLEAVYLGADSLGSVSQLPGVFRLVEGSDTKRYMDRVFNGRCVQIDLEVDIGLVRGALSADEVDEPVHGTLTTEINHPKPKRLFLSDKDKEKESSRKLISSHEYDGLSFHQYVATNPIIRSSADGGFAPSELFQTPLAVSVNPPSQSMTVQLLDKVVMKRKKRVLIDLLRRIEPRLEDLHSLSPDGELRVYVELEEQANAVPLPQLGHGFSRLLYLYCSLLVTESKLALLDEVENGIHFASLLTLFKGIQDMAANQGIQTLMTTHSWECIRAAYKTFADANCLKDFQLIRLERDGDNVKAVVINDDALDTVMEAGYEVR
ncbi:MAG: AAA family ATPase [Rhodoferax sp.]